MSDPILDELGVGVRRIGMFLFLTFSTWLCLWLWIWVLFHGYQLNWPAIARVTRAAWPPAADLTIALLFWGCCALGVETTLVVYLTVALWWRGRGDVHRRGTKFLDERRD